VTSLFYFYEVKRMRPQTQPVAVLEAESTELIREGDPRFGIISIDPERLSGEPCFAGTRVPVKTLWSHLEAGGTLDIFLEDFEGVTREQAIAALKLAKTNFQEEDENVY
jgi:uncharacterized protein (DUF433 family)